MDLDLGEALRTATDKQFFSTSLTWSRALKVPLYINANDKQWYARKPEIKDDEVVWWRDKITLSEGVDVIECGG